MPSIVQENEFAAEIQKFAGETRYGTPQIGNGALNVAMAWIANHLTPEEVFSVNALEYWARHHDWERKVK